MTNRFFNAVVVAKSLYDHSGSREKFVQDVHSALHFERERRTASPRELLCEDCDHEYVVWFAPNDLWNRVVRAKYADRSEPFLCPTCFTVRCDADGVEYTAFEVRVAEQLQRPAGANAAQEVQSPPTDGRDSAAPVEYRDITGCSHALHEGCEVCSCPTCGTRSAVVSHKASSATFRLPITAIRDAASRSSGATKP